MRSLVGPGARAPVIAAVVVVLAAVVGLLHGMRSDAEPTPGPPLKQWLFSATVRYAQDRVHAGNAVTLVAARRQRDRRLCRILPGRHAVDWVGRLTGVSTTLAQDGTVNVDLGDDVVLHTAPNALLRPDTRIFESVANLHDGDLVMFSGHFVGSGDRTCLRSTNLLHHTGVLSPDFEFRFGSIREGQ